ncbi:LptF/LptG family permease [Porphyromonas sp.]
MAIVDVLKIVDKYILRTFIPLFVMSFAVCWFIVVMQFLWRYIDELVGKGLSGFMLLKIIFYAALSFIPMSLPLGILLASLMTLGNLGERLELLALKASGIRLYRIIRPIMLLVLAMACGLFYFQNDLMIRAQVRMWTLVITAKYAAPEMEITPGVFYTGIPGYSLYAKDRDAGTGLMHRMMVYDMSRGYLNPRIIRADSGRLVMDKSKKFLVLKLYQGQSFENIQTQSYNTSTDAVPYMLPHFDYSETFIPFDANIKMQDEGELSSMYVGKNLHQLQQSIDSIRPILDSTRLSYAQVVGASLMESHFGTSSYAYQDSATRVQAQARLTQLEQQTRHSKGEDASLTLTPQDSLQAFAMARDKADRVKEEASLYIDTDDAQFYQFRTLHQEWHRKFTFPVSCIIFALIGSSLGAIVRRGGIGMPIIISIFFFVVYFIIDSFGTNMLRNESIPIWLGMWLSNIVLFPIGIFLAYKANQDSSALNVEIYVIFFRKLFGFRGVRKVEYQELIIEEADYKAGALAVAQALKHTDALLQGSLFSGRIWSIWTRGAEQRQLATLSKELDDITESLRHTPSRLLVSKLCDLPLLPTRLSPFLPEEPRWGRILGALLPLSLPFGLFLSRVRTHLRADLRTTRTVLLQIADEVAAADERTHTPPLK